MAKPVKGTAHFVVDLMGFDFYATVDFTFRPGCGPSWCRRIGTWDPPEPDEIEIHAIWLQLDEPGKLSPKWEIDGALLDVIAELTRVDDAVREEASELMEAA